MEPGHSGGGREIFPMEAEVNVPDPWLLTTCAMGAVPACGPMTAPALEQLPLSVTNVFDVFWLKGTEVLVKVHNSAHPLSLMLTA